MVIDVERYREATTPEHILKLLDESTLQHLLNGFAYKLEAGVSVLWRARAEDSSWRWAGMNLMDDPVLAGRVAHPFCALYCSHPEHNARCTKCDEERAAEYYNGERSGPRLCRCHAQLWDMTYPLKLDGQLLGVLFGGQIVVAGPGSRWWDDFQQVAQYVESPGVEADGQLEAIRRRLPEIAEVQHVEGLLKLTQSDRMKVVEPSRAVRRFQDFLDFGRTLEGLTRNLHQVRAEAARQTLLRQVDEYLATGLSDRVQLWTRVAEAAGWIREAAGVGPARIYERRGSRFIERVREGRIQDEETAHRVPASVCYRVPFGEIASIAMIDGLATPLASAADDWVFRTSSPVENGHSFSVLFVFDREPDELARGFCMAVGLRGQIASLLFRIADDQEVLQSRTRHVSHAAKTPLMAAMSLARQARRTSQPEMVAAKLEAIEEALYDARAEIGVFYEGMPVARQNVDLRELLKSLAEKMRPLAEAKRCRIVLRLSEAPLVAFITPREMAVALRNLLDNAIKYSFNDRNVTIAARRIGRERTVIVFENFGVGTPPGSLEDILEGGRRGNAPDPGWDRRRRGTGLGVPIAQEILHRHDGTLEIESRETPGSEPGTWLRCVTTATVTLPTGTTED